MNKNSAVEHNNRGLDLNKKCDYKSAIESFNNAIKIDPNF